MPQSLGIPAFLQAPGPVLDVRSPGEFDQGHIPGAINLPLFSNPERVAVGTCYKQQGREAAVELGLVIVGPKLADLVHQAKALAPDRQIRIHCWRGGMRSASLGMVLEMAGFKVALLERGYKAFRQWVRQVLAQPRSLYIVGGMTGTGKTEALLALKDLGEQVVDLEGLAHHRGSSYGNLGLPPQPTTEHYENDLAWALAGCDRQRPVWIEAESRQVGTCRIPPELFSQMEQAPVLELVRSLGDRLALLTQVYGDCDRADLMTATERIRKRLGGLRTQQALDHIQGGNLTAAMAIVLAYYDQTYRYDLDRRAVPCYPLIVTDRSPSAVAQALQHLAQATLAPPTP
ncbi:tRNA 2-selenouridine(34) synthase MnmH [Prochlorothrix hollandica]|uniref:tRNA 2-selenouridine(34) synthase MnmH n=1 Tax=Prochlorothrix hollandica TaxID=1223 RepID=UPI00333E24A0